MRFSLFIDNERDEEVVVYAREKSRLVEEIERLVSEDSLELVSYKDSSIIKLSLSQVYCFVVEDGKTYAVTETDKLLIKHRLYQLEERVTSNFVKINQSCIANIKQIERFDVAFSGTLRVVFKNGHSDYVSRRQVRAVKERLGV